MKKRMLCFILSAAFLNTAAVVTAFSMTSSEAAIYNATPVEERYYYGKLKEFKNDTITITVEKDGKTEDISLPVRAETQYFNSNSDGDKLTPIDKNAFTVGDTIKIDYYYQYGVFNAGKVTKYYVPLHAETKAIYSPTGKIEAVGAREISKKDETLTSETFQSEEADQTSLLVKDGRIGTIRKSEIKKSVDSTNTDESRIFGINSAVLVKPSSKVLLQSTNVKTTGNHSNGVFVSGKDASATFSSGLVETMGSNSKGLVAVDGGKITTSYVDVTTHGESSPAVKVERGDGEVTMTGGTMITEGLNSPAINSLDSVIIKDATVSAYQSSFGVIDGNGLISMTNSRLYAGKNRGFEIIDTESGLNTSGTGTVRILNGSLTVEEGPVFYVTNTKASIKMDQTTVKNKADLLVAEASSYGLAGRNGGEVVLSSTNQKLKGDIKADKYSTVTFDIGEKTTYTGAINGENTAKAVNVSLEKNSLWEVTGTSYVDVLKDADYNLTNIITNGNYVYYNADNPENHWLGGIDHTFNDGGKLIAVKDKK
ncbi:MAG: hypothetical protein KHZ62_07235 [Clostridiales bacterium]|nr:hypothetical protein [Clostridiales bacterium]